MTQQYPVANESERAKYVTVVADVPKVNLSPEITTQLVLGQNMTLSFSEVPAGAPGAIHSHPHEQMIVVLSGKIDIIVDGKAYRIGVGDVLWVPGDVPHGGMGLDEPCRMVEIFTPARKDFEEKLRQARSAS
jgi:quercetin dioxygenase-like cupin family protein